MTQTFRRSIRFWKREYHRTVKIEGGWKVRMDFWFWDYPKINESDAGVSLIAYQGLYLGKWTWRKEGSAIGPGGLRVASAALKLLKEVEQIAPQKAKHGNVWLDVSAASLGLYLLYRKVLSKRGYHESFEDPREYEVLMVKRLRSELEL